MKIKAFLKKWVFKNAGYKLLALALAFILWIVILNVTDPDTTKTISNIPVTILNEEEILDGTRIYEIVSGDITSITVTGSRSIVSGLSEDDFVATADFSELSTSNTVLINVEMTGDMSKYSSKLDITVKTPSMVLSIDEITTLKVAVEIVFTGEKEDDEFIDDEYSTPEYVTITAPQSVLDTVESAVAYVDYSEIDGDTSIRTPIYILDSDGKEVDLGSYGSTDCSSVIVEIEASYTKTVEIYMDDPEDTTADGYEYTGLGYTMDTVVIKGSKTLIENIETVEIPSALLDLTDAKSNVSVLANLSDYLPDGVSVYGSISSVVITAYVEESDETEAASEEEATSDETSADDEEADETDSADEEESASTEETSQ